MNKKLLLKLFGTLLLVLILLGSFNVLFQNEKKEIVKGESNIHLNYRFYLINEGPTDLSYLSLRLALLKSWEPYQFVNDIVIDVQPNRSTTDEYSNEFIWYEFDSFKAGQVLDIMISANITLKFVDYTGYSFSNTFAYDQNSDLYRKYMAFNPLADPTDLRISNTASKLAGSTSIDSIFNAYNFTSSFLRYRLLSEEHGATFALNNGYGDCDEYQDLFIALLRSMGIPVIGHTAWFGEFAPGFVSTDSGSIAHAFPAFYVPDVGLIPADPTRGKDALFDNWIKTDYKRITLTQGPDQPYRLLNYKWVPIEGEPDPLIVSNYTINILDLQNSYTSTLRSTVLFGLIFLPVTYVVYNLYVAKKVKQEQNRKLQELLSP